jgi:hypothetical protein
MPFNMLESRGVDDDIFSEFTVIWFLEVVHNLILCKGHSVLGTGSVTILIWKSKEASANLGLVGTAIHGHWITCVSKLPLCMYVYMHLGLGFFSGSLRNLIVEVPAEAQNTYRRKCLTEN